MFELLFRVGFAGAMVALSAIYGRPSFDIGWRVSAFVCAYAVLTHLMERRQLRNSGVSGLIAVADSGVFAFVMGSAGVLGSFGFLVLAPCAYAVTRFGSNSAAMAPLAASWLLVSHNLFQQTQPSASLLGQALAVLGIGLLMNQSRIVMTVTKEVQVPSDPITQGIEPQTYMELRENFRKIRDYCRELERKSRRAQIASQLYEAAHGTGDRLQQRLANRMRDIVRCEGLCLYTSAQMGSIMVIRGTSGTMPTELQTTSFDLTNVLSDAAVRQRIDLQLSSIRSEHQLQQTASVLLKDRGRLVGLLFLSDPNPEILEKAVARAEQAAPVVALLLREEIECEQLKTRLKETEMLYCVASVAHGADTPTSVASRTVRELWNTIQLDHLAVHFIDGSDSILVAMQGASCALLESLRFGIEQGVNGWLESGAPELTMFDATDDPRCNRTEALKKRVGSFCVIPIQFDDRPYGFVTAATHRIGGLDVREVETLRIVAAELGQAIARLQERDASLWGMVTPKEFQQQIVRSQTGCLVYLEPLKKDSLIEEYGQPAFDLAVRQFGRRLRSKLPTGGLLCRRTEGDYIVFLQGCHEEFARSWANEATAMASMIGIKTPDGRAKIPLAFRSKVARKSRTEEIRDAEMRLTG